VKRHEQDNPNRPPRCGCSPGRLRRRQRHVRHDSPWQHAGHGDGTITGFGSIYVNGVHFKTTSATIRKNGQVVAQSALRVGEIARIKARKMTAKVMPTASMLTRTS